MKEMIQVVILILIIITWLTPVGIAFYTGDFWLIFIYMVWWIPAMILTGLFIAIMENLEL